MAKCLQRHCHTLQDDCRDGDGEILYVDFRIFKYPGSICISVNMKGKSSEKRKIPGKARERVDLTPFSDIIMPERCKELTRTTDHAADPDFSCRSSGFERDYFCYNRIYI